MLDAPFIRTFIGSFINFVVLFITTPQEIITLRVTFARVAVAVAVAATATIAIADQSWNAIASTLPRVLATLPAPQKSRVGAEIDCLFEFIYF